MDASDDAPSARAPEPEDLARVCRALNDAGARYVLVGGFAVVAHGAGRFTKDIDLLIDDAKTWHASGRPCQYCLTTQPCVARQRDRRGRMIT